MDRYYAELEAEGGRFVEAFDGADLGATVLTCPEWTLAQLAEHVGQAHRWAAHAVTTRATGMPAFEDVPDVRLPEGAAERVDWLRAGPRRLVAAVREAGPDAPVWNWSQDHRAGFWVRRMLHETVVHRADAALTTGRPFAVDPEVAVDGLDEWLGFLSLPAMLERKPGLRAETTRTLSFVATDVGDDLAGRWSVRRGPDGVTVQRGGSDPRGADVTVQGPAADLWLVAVRRLPVADAAVEVSGDVSVLDDWLANSAF
nr:maleylpyruvate isomerase family mycothiol-dependent enzyme [Streptoalloteichus tenebrarius]